MLMNVSLLDFAEMSGCVHHQKRFKLSRKRSNVEMPQIRGHNISSNRNAVFMWNFYHVSARFQVKLLPSVYAFSIRQEIGC